MSHNLWRKFIKTPKHDLIDNFNNTFRYLDDVLTLNNPEFSKLVDEIYPKELTLTKSNSDSSHTPFLYLDTAYYLRLSQVRKYGQRRVFVTFYS